MRSRHSGLAQNQHALILCIINGDELIFNRDLLIQGYTGGRAAAQQLTQRIAAQLSSEEVHVYGRLSFWTTLYFDRMDLAEDLSVNNICSHDQFHAFVAVSPCDVHVLAILDFHDRGSPKLLQGFARSIPAIVKRRWSPKYKVSLWPNSLQCEPLKHGT